jgi:preprotein translocase subunit SecD
MKRAHKRLSLLLALLLLGLSSACNRNRSDGHLFGPKDEGGIYLVIAVKADAAQLDQSIQQTIAVMQKRCKQLYVGCKLERQSGDKSNQIMLRISSPRNPERIKSVLLSEGMEIRAVVSPPSPAPVQTYTTRAEAATAAGTDKDVFPYQERKEGAGANAEKFVVVERTPIVAGQDISDAEATPYGGDKDYLITFQLTPASAQRFGEWTGANINRYLAVVLNKTVRSVAYIKGQIFDKGQISGGFTEEEAEDIALILKSGNLPAPIEALEEGMYKP